MSTEAKIDTCYIDVLRKRKLSHAEKRGKYFDALWALPQDEYDGDQRAIANYHKGHEEAIAMIIEELVAPDESEKLQPMKTIGDFYCSECFLQMYKVPCNPEDGAMVGYCPNCNDRQTFLRGNSPKRTWTS